MATHQITPPLTSNVYFVASKKIKGFACFGQITPVGDNDGEADPVFWPGTYDAGNYQITYLGGARYFPIDPACFFLNYAHGLGGNYEMYYSGGDQEEAFPPGTYGCYGSQADVEAANPNAVFSFTHTGGQIGISVDPPKTFPQSDGGLQPYFQLCGEIDGLQSQVYFVGNSYRAITSNVVFGLPSKVVAFSLESNVYFQGPPLPPGQQNLLSKYLQRQRDALLQKPCTTCAPIDCIDLEANYSLQSPAFPTVLVCPEGFDCNAIGEEFHLLCCDGTVYDLHFSPQVSKEDRQRIANAAIAECSRKLPFCNIDPCPTPPCNQNWLYWNNAIDCTAKCDTSEGGTFKWTVPTGTYLAFSQIAADQAAGKAACQLAKQHRICFLGLQSGACVGTPYSDNVIISGQFVAAYPNSDTISIVSGALPDGLTFNNGSSFVTGGKAPISGTPTVGGTFSFTVRIVLGTLNDGFGDTQSHTYIIKVAQIQPDTLPDAVIGSPYSQNLSVIPAHDQETESWTVVTSLPAGLSLTSAGVLHGTPTGPSESHNVTVRCAFTLDGKQTFCTKQFTLTVNSDSITPVITSSTPVCWGTFPAGTYRVSYVNGAFRYAVANPLFYVNNILSTGYEIKYNGGATTDYFSELTATGFASQALCEAANAGKTHDIVHTGGTICMYLHDLDYGDNVAGSPNPTFRITKIA